MHHAAHEPEPLGDVAPVVPDILFRCASILRHPLIEIVRPSEDVGSVPLLRHLDHRRILQLKDILVAVQEHLSGTLAELLVVEEIVVRLPRDLRDFEIGWQAKVATNARELRSLDGFVFETLADCIGGVEKPAKPLVHLLSAGERRIHVSRKRYSESARNGSFPFDQAPLSVSESIPSRS